MCDYIICIERYINIYNMNIYIIYIDICVESIYIYAYI